MLWHAVIDNLATYRTATLQLDVERHTAFALDRRGQRCFAAPRYSMMLVAVGALEPGGINRLINRPLSASTFKSAMSALPGYALVKETPGRVIYTAPEKRLLADWLPATFHHSPRAGAMVGFIQLKVVRRLQKVTDKIVPAAVDDFNALSAALSLREAVDPAALKRLAGRAEAADKRLPKGTAAPPRRAWRYLFEQE